MSSRKLDFQAPHMAARAAPSNFPQNMKTCLLCFVLCIAVISCGCTRSTSETKAPEIAVVSDGKSTTAEAIPSAAPVLQPLGARALLGRDFVAEDLRGGSPAVAIISSELWAAAFASRPDVLGHKIQVSHQEFVIIGIAPGTPPSLAGRKVWLALQN